MERRREAARRKQEEAVKLCEQEEELADLEKAKAMAEVQIEFERKRQAVINRSKMNKSRKDLEETMKDINETQVAEKGRMSKIVAQAEENYDEDDMDSLLEENTMLKGIRSSRASSRSSYRSSSRASSTRTSYRSASRASSRASSTRYLLPDHSSTPDAPAAPSRPPRALSPVIKVLPPPQRSRRSSTPEARVVVLPPVSIATTTITTTTTTAPRMSVSASKTRHRKEPRAVASRPMSPSPRHNPTGDSAEVASVRDYTQDWVNNVQSDPQSQALALPASTTAGVVMPPPATVPYHSSKYDAPLHPLVPAPKSSRPRTERLVVVSQVPQLPVPVFKGDPREYPNFLMGFKEVIEEVVDDPGKCYRHLLTKLEGEPRELIRCYDHMDQDEAYPLCMDLLHEEYGTPDGLVEYWLHQIKRQPFNSVAEYGKTLRSAFNALSKANALSLVDSRAAILDMSERLPDQMQIKWAEKVAEIKRDSKREGSKRVGSKREGGLTFRHFVEFVEWKGEALKDRYFGKAASRALDREAARSKQQSNSSRPHTSHSSSSRPLKRSSQSSSHPSKRIPSSRPAERQPVKSSPLTYSQVANSPPKSPPKAVKVFATTEKSGGSKKGGPACNFCSARHTTEKCPALKEVKVHIRVKWIADKGLCFVCLGKGHMASECEAENPCNREGCQGRHAAMLHGAKWPKREGGSRESSPSRGPKKDKRGGKTSEKTKSTPGTEASVSGDQE